MSEAGVRGSSVSVEGVLRYRVEVHLSTSDGSVTHRRRGDRRGREGRGRGGGGRCGTEELAGTGKPAHSNHGGAAPLCSDELQASLDTSTPRQRRAAAAWAATIELCRTSLMMRSSSRGGGDFHLSERSESCRAPLQRSRVNRSCGAAALGFLCGNLSLCPSSSPVLLAPLALRLCFGNIAPPPWCAARSSPIAVQHNPRAFTALHHTAPHHLTASAPSSFFFSFPSSLPFLVLSLTSFPPSMLSSSLALRRLTLGDALLSALPRPPSACAPSQPAKTSPLGSDTALAPTAAHSGSQHLSPQDTAVAHPNTEGRAVVRLHRSSCHARSSLCDDPLRSRAALVSSAGQ